MDSKMSHTPGPWTIWNGEIHADDHGSHKVLGTVFGVGGDSFSASEPGEEELCPLAEECVANALLIAAAPDLLAACQAILARCNEGHWLLDTQVEMMRAAVAKAEGRG